MAPLVLKFGGASVASPDSFAKIAEIVLERRRLCPQIVVVVSAMGDMTDQLLALAHQVNPSPPRREVDMLVSVGERISVSLLAMALAAKGSEAVSFTGSQSGIITTADHNEAQIVEVRPERLLAPLAEGRIVLVAGFQGVSRTKEITTLGRGGSDTTAVALAAALGAERVEFFKDVGGIYSADPKSCPDAELIPKLTYEEALDLCQRGGHPVLHPRSLALAQQNQLPLHILPFSKELKGGTLILPTSGRRGGAKPIFEVVESYV